MSVDNGSDVTAWLDRILGHEGGFQRDPADPGNWTGGAPGSGVLVGTRWGISAAAYPTLDIPNLTIADAGAIYRRDYLARLGVARFADGIQFQMLDAAIHSGIRTAVRMAQRALGVKDDGMVGPNTIAALSAIGASDFIMRFLAERLDYLSGLRTWDVYSKGWTHRIAANLRYGAEDS